VSISSRFYACFFADILAPKNFKPKTQLCNFWCQNIGAKCAHKMLMKLTIGELVPGTHIAFVRDVEQKCLLNWITGN